MLLVEQGLRGWEQGLLDIIGAVCEQNHMTKSSFTVLLPITIQFLQLAFTKRTVSKVV